MDLFLPESGLVIWMSIAFFIVFIVLAKAGWPMIMNSVNERNQHIADALQAAQEAKDTLASVESKSKEISAQAQAEQIRIMKESQELRNQMLEEAKSQARKEAEKIVIDARSRIEKEKEEALSQIKGEMVALSISMAEKLLQRELEDKKSQSNYVEQLLKNKDKIQA
jgi:ATP synthase, F0 subunit b